MTYLLAGAGGVLAFNVGFLLGAVWGGMWSKADCVLERYEIRDRDSTDS